jgi:hypothetical protein
VNVFYWVYFSRQDRPHISLYFSTFQAGRLVLETIVTSDVLFVQQTKQSGIQWKLTKFSRAKNFKVCQSVLKFLAKKPNVTHPKYWKVRSGIKWKWSESKGTRRKRKISVRHRKVTWHNAKENRIRKCNAKQRRRASTMRSSTHIQ